MTSSALEEELTRLRLENAQLRQQLEASAAGPRQGTTGWTSAAHSLTSHQVERYSRQMLLKSFGAEAQAKLCGASMLVIGAGGLGSPCLLYLGAAGVGRIGIVDKDTVDLSNLHRQTIHRESGVGMHKAVSARQALLEINHTLKVDVYTDGFTPSNAVSIVTPYDLVIDCSDNAPTRYLINDTCAALKKPLVSGAAIGTDGQLTVYCGGGTCPCYRCLYPEAPVAANCQRCNEAGVLGVVPGIIGTLQALEAIKIVTGKGDPLRQKLLIFDALSMRFSVMRLRPSNPDCPACGTAPSITRDSIASYDYYLFTGQDFTEDLRLDLKVLPGDQRMTPAQFRDTVMQGQVSTSSDSDSNPILDVRPRTQFDLAQLPGSLNVPYDDEFTQFVADEGRLGQLHKDRPLYVLCRRGNHSQLAVQRLREAGFQQAVDLVGGLEQWKEEVDDSFPKY